MKEAFYHSQWHVHNGSNTPCCCRPSGRPETFPGCPARFVYVHVTVHYTRHHYAVAHIQHLSAQTESGRRGLACISGTMMFRIFVVLFALYVTSQAISTECGCICLILPSFMISTAGRSSRPSSTRLLLTAFTVDPGSMFVCIQRHRIVKCVPKTDGANSTSPEAPPPENHAPYR